MSLSLFDYQHTFKEAQKCEGYDWRQSGTERRHFVGLNNQVKPERGEICDDETHFVLFDECCVDDIFRFSELKVETNIQILALLTNLLKCKIHL